MNQNPPPLPTRPPVFEVEQVERQSLGFRILKAVNTFFDYVYGLITILLVLAACSAVPLIQFFGLGYFLESSARIAKSGKIRNGFIGLKPASAVGKVIVVGYLIFLPIRLLHSYWSDSQIIVPGSELSAGLKSGLIILTTMAIFSLSWAIIRGGRFRHYIWPAPFRFARWLGEPKNWRELTGILRYIQSAGQCILDFFKLGFCGFAGAAIWLIVPVGTLFLAAQISSQGLSLLISILGSILLGIVAVYIPFLQTRYAMNRKFSEFGNVRGVRADFRKAPVTYCVAIFLALLFALPLYLLKIELTPREVAWIPNLVFVLFMFPTRLLVGWAMARANKRETSTHWLFRILSRLGMLPAVVVYVFIVWLNQFLSWYGSYSLFEQHAFLLPAPMLGI